MKILAIFIIGFIWGVLYTLDKDNNTPSALDSCETIKEIINKY